MVCRKEAGKYPDKTPVREALAVVQGGYNEDLNKVNGIETVEDRM